jgi:ATP-dependent DNA helicase RecQ
LTHTAYNTEKLSKLLAKDFGFNQFRPGQAKAIGQLLNGDSTLAIFPTGSGKSLCYQLTALHLPHLTLVISPLLALIKDQLTFLASKGIKAASIDSTLSSHEAKTVMSGVRDGGIKVLMVSVERFKNERFRQFIESVPVSMLVIDEAHCISEWGHNFRPDYLKLPAYRKALNIPLVLMLTATATRQVKEDMATKFAIKTEHIVQTGFYRANLELNVVTVAEIDKNQRLSELILAQTGAGIVYVTLQQTAEQVAQYLIQQGFNASAYHAGFDSDKRQRIQHDFMQGHITIIVATIAFGMGIDKSNIRFVVHYDLPKSIENYSQEIGRAGRDGLSSRCFTLANLDGLTTVENFVYGDTPEHSAIARLLKIIVDETITQHNTGILGYWELQLLALSKEVNIKQLPLKTLLVQLELAGIIEPQYSYFAEFKIKLLQSKEHIISGFDDQRQIFLTHIFNAIQFKKVWGSLDFDKLLQEPTIERSRVIAALEYLQDKQCIILETKGMTEVFKVHVKALSNPNLTKYLSDYFYNNEQKEIQRIDNLVSFFERDTCLTANLAKYFDDHAFSEDIVNYQCGHCSVCHGQVAHLELSTTTKLWPSDATLKEAMHLLENCLSTSTYQISINMYCRFLAGISMPLFTVYKVRKLAGFGLCEHYRFKDIQAKVTCLVGKL